MYKSPSEDLAPLITLLEKLADGPLSLKATAFHQGLMGGFERYAKRVLLHPRYPWVIRWFLIGFLVTLTYSAFWGPNDARLNFATVMSWLVWWPLLAVSYLILGRVWCGFCPMGALSELIHRKIGLNRKAPGILKKRWWVAGLLASAIFYQAWIEEVTRASYSPLFTGLILLSFTAGAVLCGFVFERWTWCRHLCPLGAWSGVLAMSSMVEVRADPSICLARRCKGIYCYFGRENLPGCPFHQVPKIIETNRYCATCGNCLKACPNDAISIQLRWPGHEFFIQKKEMLENSLISVAAVGVVAFQLFVMTDKWAIIYEQASKLPLFSNDALLYGVCILAIVGLVIAFFISVSRLYALLTRQPIQQEMCRFGFAFLPLALMGHISHNLGHLLTGYQFVPGAIAGLIGQTPSVPIEGLPNHWPWLALKISLVLIGLGMSIWSLRSVCNARRAVCPQQPAAIPYIGLAVLFASTFIFLIALPMVSRV
ncbi:MAG TPA: 4Fe-4S binding protein [Anaerolineales bacterium]|nr:4Fe-4S binding protein [Anaerolineales bacterium]